MKFRSITISRSIRGILTFQYRPSPKTRRILAALRRAGRTRSVKMQTDSRRALVCPPTSALPRRVDRNALLIPTVLQKSPVST